MAGALDGERDGIYLSSGSSATNCTANFNAAQGIVGGDASSVVADCAVASNTGDGIDANNSLARGNSASVVTR